MASPCVSHVDAPYRGAGLKEGLGVTVTSRTGQEFGDPCLSSLPLPTVSEFQVSAGPH